MTIIKLSTEIDANIDTCFDLCRDIDIHQRSANQTNERAIDGRTSGLCELGDWITWEATHFGIKQHLTVKITKFNRPHSFEDVMLGGAFKSMRHQHSFELKNDRTIMKDIFEYQIPFGIIGKIFDKLILKKYMTNFLLKRNNILKEIAERRLE